MSQFRERGAGPGRVHVRGSGEKWIVDALTRQTKAIEGFGQQVARLEARDIRRGGGTSSSQVSNVQKIAAHLWRSKPYGTDCGWFSHVCCFHLFSCSHIRNGDDVGGDSECIGPC